MRRVLALSTCVLAGFALASIGGAFARGGDKANEIPLRRLVGRAVTIDLSARVGDNADYLISRADLRRWERRNGRIPRRAIVLLRTGWERFWPNAERYLGK